MRIPAFLKVAVMACALVAISSCSLFSSDPNRPKPITKADRMRELSTIKTQMAVEYLRQQDYRGAKEASDHAVKANPKEAKAWLVRAYVYQTLKNLGEAERSYRAALGLQPNSAEMNNNFGWFLCDSKKSYAEAFPYFQRAIDDPTYPTPYTAYTNLAICQSRMGDYARANLNFDKAQTLNPNYTLIYRERAASLLKQGKVDEASWMFDKFQGMVVAMGPDDLFVGWKIAKALGNQTMQFEYEAQLRDNYPNSPAMRTLLGDLVGQGSQAGQ